MKKTLILVTLLTSLGFGKQYFNLDQQVAMEKQAKLLCDMSKDALVSHTSQMKENNKSDKTTIALFNSYKQEAYAYCKI